MFNSFRVKLAPPPEDDLPPVADSVPRFEKFHVPAAFRISSICGSSRVRSFICALPPRSEKSPALTLTSLAVAKGAAEGKAEDSAIESPSTRILKGSSRRCNSPKVTGRPSFCCNSA